MMQMIEGFFTLERKNKRKMSQDDRATVKMSGYLEKKAKMKMMSSWKTYWFVLKGRLLLYYRSKSEYESLSPCKGSISLGPACTTKPLLGTSCVFQIETRTNTVILKAKTRLIQEKWLEAILSALNQNSTTSTGMIHFRYSSGDLVPPPEDKEKLHRYLTRQHSIPDGMKKRKKSILNCKPTVSQNDQHVVDKEKNLTINKIVTDDHRNTSNDKEITTKGNDLYVAGSLNDDETVVLRRRRSVEDDAKVYDDNMNGNEYDATANNETYQEINQYSVIRETLYDYPMVNRVDADREETREEKPQLPKKKSFLKNLFKTKKKSGGDEEREVVEKSSTPNSRQMLEELHSILKYKKDVLSNGAESVYEEITEIRSERSGTGGTASNGSDVTTVKTIDEIIDDLNAMRTGNEVPCSKVRSLIAKFDNAVTNNGYFEQSNVYDEVEVAANATIVDNCLYESLDKNKDDLNFLLNELAKVTNAPVLTPGVTTSLGLNSKTEQEFGFLSKVKQRRHSDPDYDVPRPHSNLKLVIEKKPDALVATRFFGPVLNYDDNESLQISTMTSMAPDSLEVQFIDSLEHFVETSTVL